MTYNYIESTLSTGETYKYESNFIYSHSTAEFARNQSSNDFNFIGLVPSNRVTEKNFSEDKFSDLLTNLASSGFKPRNNDQLAGLARGLSRASYSDDWTLSIPVAPVRYPPPSQSLPTVYFSQPKLKHFEVENSPSLAQARQIREIYKLKNCKRRTKARDLMGYLQDRWWPTVLPSDYIGNEYDPQSMQKLMFMSTETAFGSDRKGVLKGYIEQSKAKRVITFLASEVVTASVGDVSEVILFSLLDYPAADAYESFYDSIMKSHHPRVKVYVVRMGCTSTDFLSMSRAEIIAGLKLPDQITVFLFNFFPEFIKLAGQFKYSLGYYQSVEYAEKLRVVEGPPRLFDMALDRMSVTHFMLADDPTLLEKSHSAVYDKRHQVVLAYSEHLAFPDKVYEDRKGRLPPNVVSVPIQVCSKKATSNSRIKVFMGVGGQVANVYPLVPPKLDVSLIATHSSHVKYVPSTNYQKAVLASNTIVYPKRTVVYPRTTTYVYTELDGMKIFLDMELPRLTFLERRQVMHSAGMLLVPLASDPLWDSSILIDLRQRKMDFDVGVVKETFSDPLRKWKMKKHLSKLIEPIQFPGFSLAPHGGLVRDDLGTFVYSPLAEIPSLFIDDLDRRPPKTRRGETHQSFKSILGDHMFTITIAVGKDYTRVNPYYLYEIICKGGVPVEHANEVLRALLDEEESED